MQYNSILLRHGEMGLKSERNRAFFEKQYVRAIRDALNRNNITSYNIASIGQRFFITCDSIDKILPILKNIPGIQGYSPSFVFSFDDKEDLLKKAADISTPFVKNKIFRVRARRAGVHKFSSMEIARELADCVFDASAGVNLKEPEVTVSLEVRNKRCFIFTESFKAIGGLPPTSAGHALALFSGGIDSPIAVYHMLKRGVAVDFLFINMMGDASFEEVAKVYNYMVNKFVFGYKPKLYVFDAQPIVKKLREDVNDSLRQIALKIVYYKIAEKIAINNNHVALITGEALSQKSSQTLGSLRVINSQVDIPVLRPLIGADKIDIMELAREIGTLSLSESVKEYCNLAEGPVTTNPNMLVLKSIPDYSESINKGLEYLTVLKGAVSLNDKDDIPVDDKKALVVDLRVPAAIEKLPVDSFKAIQYPEVLDHLDEFTKDDEYIFICNYGVRSVDVATRLQKEGIAAKGVSVKKYLGILDGVSCQRSIK